MVGCCGLLMGVMFGYRFGFLVLDLGELFSGFVLGFCFWVLWLELVVLRCF